jgi:Holliday junction resolvase RusA-like endonuclease
MQTFEFDFTLPRKAMLNSNDRLHYQAKAKITRELRDTAHRKVTRELGKIETPKFTKNKPCKILVETFSPTNRKYDPPNIYPTIKALQDGMTDANLFEDDNFTIVKSMTFKHGGKSQAPNCYQIKITIKECQVMW